MNINKAFPGEFLNAGHIGNARPRVVIEGCQVENFDNGDAKPVLRFQNKERGLVLNKTNANIIAEKYGDETEGWIGLPLVLYSAKVQFKDKMVDGVRVEIPSGNGEAAPSVPVKPEPVAAASADEVPDDVPF